jgi:uncharacterized protein (TIGR02217 family)
MAFHEIRFPVDIAYGSVGGPVRRTDIIMLDSGFEQRNTTWSQSMHKFNVAYGIKTYDQLYAVKQFWEARLGRLYGFRYKDWADFKSGLPTSTVSNVDQQLGTGDGSKTTFQLRKAYTSGSSTYYRSISKPVSGTTVIALNGVSSVSGWTVDTTTGIVTFSVAPSNGVIVTAGFEFDVPVRFDTDEMNTALSAYTTGNLDELSLIEIRV